MIGGCVMRYAVKSSRKTKSRQEARAGKLITFDEYFEIADEKMRTDLLDGIIIRDSPAFAKHGRINSWLAQVIGFYVAKHDLGEIFSPTTSVRFTQYQATEPDLFFISKARAHIVGEKFVEGAPDLCVEIVSKSSRKHDRGRKFTLYADHGVQEYWLIDPLSNTVDFFGAQQGRFIALAPDGEGRLHSNVLPGFWLKPEWLRGELPAVLPVLKEILGEEAI
ncbi:Uma2 family endonuclease [candidate division KSB1 bacterium]|nr:MAG: Uma2 family endonuclease [candidate division KSB1 bacterium]MBC6949476.1 Uma2 family endonuclease [candidate division KSB1 bacterium]MCE7944085.1 Uma2 family endonuclease [Chlorobi bacterium CHB1]MDL1874438.1 Uma2 family endonuclease [Cytophagia bacterium CHB2]